MINVLMRATLTDAYNKDVLTVISRLRSKALDGRGYISSEIVWNQTNRQFVWMSKWHNRESWKSWRMGDDCKSQLRKLDALGCQFTFEVLGYPDVEMRQESRRLGERRIHNDLNYKGPERRSGVDRRLSNDRRKPQA